MMRGVELLESVWDYPRPPRVELSAAHVVVELDGNHVHVRLYTETESQKQILVGKGGQVVRDIGRGARPHVEALLGHPVYLQLQVKAAPKWRRNQVMLERLGL